MDQHKWAKFLIHDIKCHKDKQSHSPKQLIEWRQTTTRNKISFKSSVFI